VTNTVSHQIRFDPASKLLELQLAGLVSPEDAAWIGEELRGVIRSLGADVGQHVTLYDISGVQVVPPATVELLKETFANPAVRMLWARRVAFVVATALARLQVQRLKEAREDIAIFDDRESAIAWLLEG
jgi:hypothetical protein